MPLLKFFFKKFALKRADKDYFKIILSGREINTNHPSKFKNCPERKKPRTNCDEVNKVYEAFVLTQVGGKHRLYLKLILCF